MVTLTIDNVPYALYQQVQQRAAQHHRTLNEELLVSLKQVVSAPQAEVAAILASARELRKKTAHCPLTEAEITAAKNEGRL